MNFFAKVFFSFICLGLFSGTSLADSSFYFEQGHYKITGQRWEAAVKKSSLSLDSWIWNQGVKDKLHKNKKRDAILSISRSASPEDITLIIWFHGLGGFSSKTFEKRILPQMSYLEERGESFAFAIPEMPWSTNTATPRSRQGGVWRSNYSLDKFTKEAMQRLSEWSELQHNKKIDIIRIVIVGHSAGGSAIMSASREGGLCKVDPDHIIFSDASYGRWLDRSWGGCIKKLDEEVGLHVLVRKWDKPHRNAERFLKKSKHLNRGPNVLYKILNRRKWSHGKIGNNVFKLTDVFPPGC